METPLKPILLLADSQLLFWRTAEGLFLKRIRDLLGTEHPRAAYLGASNGDLPEFFDLFCGAMAGVGIEDCRMVPTVPTASDLDFLDSADLILLAGGEPLVGWRAFECSGLRQRILECYYGGALLVGVSAGAVQLGLFGADRSSGTLDLFEAFKLVPYLVDAHSEPDWSGLSDTLPAVGDHVKGLGIPSGGGALVHPDLTIEPVRTALTELTLSGTTIYRSLLFPPGLEVSRDPSTKESSAGTSSEAVLSETSPSEGSSSERTPSNNRLSTTVH